MERARYGPATLHGQCSAATNGGHMDRNELRRAALVTGILEGADFGELIPLPEPVEMGGETCTVHMVFGRLAVALEHDQAPLPATAREALRLPGDARFADAAAALRERWGEPLDLERGL